MLCDRETVEIAASQPGFINFVVMPLFQCLSNVIPELKTPQYADRLGGGCVPNLLANRDAWENMDPEEDKRLKEQSAGGAGTVNQVMYSVAGEFRHNVES